MPVKTSAKRGGQRTDRRFQAAKAATSIMRQAGYSQRRAAFTANSLVRLGGRMPASSHELKNIDLSSTTVITFNQVTANTPILLNGVAQGTTATTRLGRRITMKSLLVKGDFSMTATGTGASPLRCLIVYDSQTNAVAATATDVLAADQFDSPMNLSNSRRFKTLLDEQIPCLGAAGPAAVHINRYVKLNHSVEFNTGSAGTVGDIQTGSIYMLWYQNGGLLTASPLSHVYTRVRFSDN